MTVEAKVIADSVSELGHRLTTIEVQFWRPMLAEFNTHRVFSRNSASSRAIPVEKTMKRVQDEPAWPAVWVCEQPGMQGGKELEGTALKDAQELFDRVRVHTLWEIDRYLEGHPDKSTRLHKSLLNRLIEPFMWHRVIVTATEWEGFFWQRCHKDAQSEIRLAAEAMREALKTSSPRMVKQGQWHLPYVDLGDVIDVRKVCNSSDETLEVLKKMSAARCARVSTLNHDGKKSVEADLTLYSRLADREENDDNPPHASPLEHVATPVGEDDASYPGNFTGWRQLRHMALRF